MKKSLLVALMAAGLGMGLSASATDIPVACYATCTIKYTACMKENGQQGPFVCESARFFCQENCLNKGDER